MILLLFLSLCVNLSFAACPDGTIPSPNFNSEWNCISVVSSPKPFSEAELHCKQNGGHLISVNNFFINHFITQTVQSIINNQQESKYWIGVKTVNGDEWENVDGSKAVFFEWEDKEPSNKNDQEKCASMDMSGYWRTEDCSTSLPFVCGVNEIDVLSNNEEQKSDVYPRPIHLVILFDGTLCDSASDHLKPQVEIVRNIIDNYTIGNQLRISFGTPIMYDTFNFYEYGCSVEAVNRSILTANSRCYPGSPALNTENNIHNTLEYSMSRLYSPDTPAFAFIVLLKNSGDPGNTAMDDAISFRKKCLDLVNAAVIVIQVDDNTYVDPELASKPGFFFKYDGTPAIGAHVSKALQQVLTYKMHAYLCKTDPAPGSSPLDECE